MKKKEYFLFTALLILSSILFVSCDNEATGQEQANTTRDFLQDILSGSVNEDPESGNFILELELAPNTAFLDESPGIGAGSFTTESFIDMFLNIPVELRPNAFLNIREDDGKLVSVPILLNKVEVEEGTAIVRYEVSPLEINTISNPGTSVDLKSIDEIDSEFGQGSLFIDGLPTGPCGEMFSVCPGFNQCCNINASPLCCDLGGGVTCENCGC